MSISTFSGLEIGRRGMNAHQTALNTTGHNISNLNTEGYSRQRVRIGTMDPLSAPALNRALTPGQLGQGPLVGSVERIFDGLHQNQILNTADNLGFWQTRSFYLERLDIIMSEPNEAGSLRNFMDNFWNSWQDLANNPENISSRAVVSQNGQALANAINNRYSLLDEQRQVLDQDIRVTVNNINQMAQQVAQLNTEIARVLAIGDNPNDLMDRRDHLIGQLAHLIPVEVSGREPTEFNVHVGGRLLVQGGEVQELRAVANQANDGLVDVHWRSNNLDFDPYTAETGSLASLIQLRDGDVYGEMQRLNAMAISFIDMTNELHRSGFGRSGETGLNFFVQHPIIEDINGNFDLNNIGEPTHTLLYRLSGANQLATNVPVGISGTMTLSGPQGNVDINYFPSDTVSDIINRINSSGADVTANLDTGGRLVLKATMTGSDNPDFVLRYVADSGHFLTGYAGLLNASGPENAFNWEGLDAGATALRTNQGASFSTAPLRHPAAWLAVNPFITADLNHIAAAAAGPNGEAAIGDNRIAIAMANLRHEKVMIDRMMSMDDFFADSAALIGSKGQEAFHTHLSYEAIYKNLNDIKESISGVNINEEFVDLVRFQHGFTASARFISTMDAILDTIINRLKL
ncbi:MAG: flagellar hook-associated protein FlgK [Spirochaetaceae bacterium]|nr:flagellar hook-associated protein FlgK [Spirochaetaceae bacterium]